MEQTIRKVGILLSTAITSVGALLFWGMNSNYEFLENLAGFMLLIGLIIHIIFLIRLIAEDQMNRPS